MDDEQGVPAVCLEDDRVGMVAVAAVPYSPSVVLHLRSNDGDTESWMLLPEDLERELSAAQKRPPRPAIGGPHRPDLETSSIFDLTTSATVRTKRPEIDPRGDVIENARRGRAQAEMDRGRPIYDVAIKLKVHLIGEADATIEALPAREVTTGTMQVVAQMLKAFEKELVSRQAPPLLG